MPLSVDLAVFRILNCTNNLQKRSTRLFPFMSFRHVRFMSFIYMMASLASGSSLKLSFLTFSHESAALFGWTKMAQDLGPILQSTVSTRDQSPFCKKYYRKAAAWALAVTSFLKGSCFWWLAASSSLVPHEPCLVWVPASTWSHLLRTHMCSSLLPLQSNPTFCLSHCILLF